MREVEGQGIGRTRSAGNCYTSSVIWGTVCIGKPTHLGFICTHLDVGGDEMLRGEGMNAQKNVWGWPRSRLRSLSGVSEHAWTKGCENVRAYSVCAEAKSDEQLQRSVGDSQLHSCASLPSAVTVFCALLPCATKLRHFVCTTLEPGDKG